MTSERERERRDGHFSLWCVASLLLQNYNKFVEERHITITEINVWIGHTLLLMCHYVIGYFVLINLGLVHKKESFSFSLFEVSTSQTERRLEERSMLSCLFMVNGAS